jgi:succinate dehydrogenase/fumarate reductase flavoprotein subunit
MRCSKDAGQRRVSKNGIIGFINPFHSEESIKNFMIQVGLCTEAGLMQGGVASLTAVGEVTAGSHGANRLGGHALAEIFTMGAALERTESRGSHFRIDFPCEDNARWLRYITIQKHASGLICHAIAAKAAPDQSYPLP